ncbi:MAG: hypothetical protein Q7J65_06995 [Candidatus Marinimicrobia bacterium]|nr:hypothetical protein [Candidatus Neomarinimicrobiota bacterium]
MKNQLRNFIEILKLELDDLQDDIHSLKKICERKLKDGLITNYVQMENMALYDNELHAINSFRNILNETNPENFDSLEKLVFHLDENFKATMKSCAYAKAGHICIERKMLKVAKYVRGDGFSN